MKLLLALTMLLSMAASAGAEDMSGKNTPNPLATWNKVWSDQRYLAANTAKDANYMSAIEKEFIYLLNLARMNPALFAQTIVTNYPDSSGDADLRKVSEYKSLLVYLADQNPMTLLTPDSLCWVSARCHALTSGQKGYVGHERLTPACKANAYFMGECCHYGGGTALDALMNLIIDQGVASLGHRLICFNPSYKKAAVSFMPHKEYVTNVVVDFYN